MSEPFIGQLGLFPFNFAPRGWAMCAGQLLPISQNTALFSLLGTTYGGNGTSNFALPDLRGRVPNGQGAGPGLQPYDMGEQGGAATVTITDATSPRHSHAFSAFTNAGTGNAPVGNALPAQAGIPGRGGGVAINIYAASGTATTLGPGQLTAAQGGNQGHNNLQPSLALNWCIAVQGIYPQRS
jgi:microcystin-dependent protein